MEKTCPNTLTLALMSRKSTIFLFMSSFLFSNFSAWAVSLGVFQCCNTLLKFSSVATFNWKCSALQYPIKILHWCSDAIWHQQREWKYNRKTVCQSPKLLYFHIRKSSFSHSALSLAVFNQYELIQLKNEHLGTQNAVTQALGTLPLYPLGLIWSSQSSYIKTRYRLYVDYTRL